MYIVFWIAAGTNSSACRLKFPLDKFSTGGQSGLPVTPLQFSSFTSLSRGVEVLEAFLAFGSNNTTSVDFKP